MYKPTTWFVPHASAKGHTLMQIEKVFVLPFASQTVYAAWVSSATVIPPATRMDIQPEVGGHYRLFIDAGGGAGDGEEDQVIMNEGSFSVVQPGERLVYTWHWSGDTEVSTIDVAFEPTADSRACQVTLKHSGFESAESRDRHASGWDSYAQGLERHLNEAAGQP